MDCFFNSLKTGTVWAGLVKSPPGRWTCIILVAASLRYTYSVWACYCLFSGKCSVCLAQEVQVSDECQGRLSWAKGLRTLSLWCQCEDLTLHDISDHFEASGLTLAQNCLECLVLMFFLFAIVLGWDFVPLYLKLTLGRIYRWLWTQDASASAYWVLKYRYFTLILGSMLSFELKRHSPTWYSNISSALFCLVCCFAVWWTCSSFTQSVLISWWTKKCNNPAASVLGHP